MTTDLRPEDLGTYLGPLPVDQDARIAQIRETIGRDSEIVATFASPGWRFIRAALEERERDVRLRIMSNTKPNRVQSVEELNAQRAVLELIQWFLMLPDATRSRLDQYRAELDGLEGDKDA
jgi:hypothetical protein